MSASAGPITGIRTQSSADQPDAGGTGRLVQSVRKGGLGRHGLTQRPPDHGEVQQAGHISRPFEPSGTGAEVGLQGRPGQGQPAEVLDPIESEVLDPPRGEA